MAKEPVILKAKESDEQAYERAMAMLDAERKIIEALRPLTQRGRARVLRFALDHIDEEGAVRQELGLTEDE